MVSQMVSWEIGGSHSLSLLHDKPQSALSSINTLHNRYFILAKYCKFRSSYCDKDGNSYHLPPMATPFLLDGSHAPSWLVPLSDVMPVTQQHRSHKDSYGPISLQLLPLPPPAHFPVFSSSRPASLFTQTLVVIIE